MLEPRSRWLYFIRHAGVGNWPLVPTREAKNESLKPRILPVYAVFRTAPPLWRLARFVSNKNLEDKNILSRRIPLVVTECVVHS